MGFPRGGFGGGGFIVGGGPVSPIVFTNDGLSATPDFANNTDLQSYNTGVWTPPSSGLIFAFVENDHATAPDVATVTGNGLTWVQIATIIVATSNATRLTLFAADATGSATGQTNIAIAGTLNTGCSVSFFHATGVDLSGGVAAAFVQAPTNSPGTLALGGSITLAPPANPLNRPIAGFVHERAEGATERPGWTEMDDVNHNAPVTGLETQVLNGSFETTASATWVQNARWAAIAAELKAVPVV